MALKIVRDVVELFVNLRHLLFQMIDGERCSDACHNVFALRVHQVFTVELVLAGGRVPREGNACARCLTHVAVDHLLHVDGRPPMRGNAVHLAIIDRAVGIPGTEHRFCCQDKLFFHILWECFALFFKVNRLELCHDTLEVVVIQVEVIRDTALFFHLIEKRFEVRAGDPHDHIREHQDEAAIAVKDKAVVARQLGQTVGDGIVQAEVQHRVHHAGHRRA